MSSKAAPQPPPSPASNVYTNMKEHILPDLRIHQQYVDEALQAILHTLLFVRAPSEVRPQDRACDALAPILYATCGISDMDMKVMTTIDLLKRSLIISSSGLHLRGEITLSFYMRKEIRGWLYSNIEHVYYERWRVPITILFAAPINTLSPGNKTAMTATQQQQQQQYPAFLLSASSIRDRDQQQQQQQRRHSTGGTNTNTTGIGFFQTSTNAALYSVDEHSLPPPQSQQPQQQQQQQQQNQQQQSVADAAMAYRHAYDLVTKAIMFIVETANTTTTQVPTNSWYFELNVSDAIELRQTPAFNNVNNSNMLTSSGKLASNNNSININNNNNISNNSNASGKFSPMVPSSSNRRM